MILRIDSHTDDRGEQPVIRQRLRPHRIDLVQWHLGRALLGRFHLLEQAARRERTDQYHR
jgi:hypothetical protein